MKAPSNAAKFVFGDNIVVGRIECVCWSKLGAASFAAEVAGLLQKDSIRLLLPDVSSEFTGRQDPESAALAPTMTCRTDRKDTLARTATQTMIKGAKKTVADRLFGNGDLYFLLVIQVDCFEIINS